MGSKELWLRLATVAAFTIPPTGALGVQNRATGALDGDIIALDLEQRARPLFIAPSSRSLKNDLRF